MKLNLNGLTDRLKKTLDPIYLIHGNEPLIVDQAVGEILQCAKSQSFNNTERLDANHQTDWDALHVSIQNQSLFSPKQCFVLHLTQEKLDAKGSEFIQDYCATPHPNAILILYGNKLESNASKAKWVSIIEEQGILLPIWPLEGAQFIDWAKRECLRRNLKMTDDALQRLTHLTEGNLLACHQEIEKLTLLNREVTLSDIEKMTANNTQFDIFKCADYFLSGNASKGIQVLVNLEARGEEPILIAWSITKELRIALDLLVTQENGQSTQSVFAKHRVFEKRKGYYHSFLKRHHANSVRLLLQKMARIDRMIKGVQPGNPWQCLQECMIP